MLWSTKESDYFGMSVIMERKDCFLCAVRKGSLFVSWLNRAAITLAIDEKVKGNYGRLDTSGTLTGLTSWHKTAGKQQMPRRILSHPQIVRGFITHVSAAIGFRITHQSPTPPPPPTSPPNVSLSCQARVRAFGEDPQESSSVQQYLLIYVQRCFEQGLLKKCLTLVKCVLHIRPFISLHDR